MSRTAEDERRDVLAFLRAEQQTARREALDDFRNDPALRGWMAGAEVMLRACISCLERGDHEGAADR